MVIYHIVIVLFLIFLCKYSWKILFFALFISSFAWVFYSVNNENSINSKINNYDVVISSNKNNYFIVNCNNQKYYLSKKYYINNKVQLINGEIDDEIVFQGAIKPLDFFHN